MGEFLARNPITIDPPLLNSSNPWATTFQDLKSLYDCPYTGAVTVRTCLLQGFIQDASIHQYKFFSTQKGSASSKTVVSPTGEARGEVLPNETSSLNTLGYSPEPLEKYLEMLVAFARVGIWKRGYKPFIISVTGTAAEVATCYARIVEVNSASYAGLSLMMEINLSCPNIPNKPPPAYDAVALSEYITAIGTARAKLEPGKKDIHVGLKTPPYTYQDQFATLMSCLKLAGSPISFITATNTLGSCLVLNSENKAALGGNGIGGLAGDALHPIALGNVRTIRQLLDKPENRILSRIQIFGVGGVKDGESWARMRSVGASCVGVGTALGRDGIDVFENIRNGVNSLKDVRFLWKTFGLPANRTT